MKHLLFKKASAIHTVKCNKSIDFNEGVASFEKLQTIKDTLQNSNELGLSSIQVEIENWKNSKPKVNQNEINEILK